MTDAKTRVLYIPQWNEHFEVAQSRKTSHPLKWIAMPTRHDGGGFRRVAASGDVDGPRAFTAFVLIAQIAAKCPNRGVLYKDGEALDSTDFALKTGYSAEMFDAAIEVLTQRKIGWLAWGEIDTETGEIADCDTTTLPQHSHSTPTALPPQDNTVQDNTQQDNESGKKTRRNTLSFGEFSNVKLTKEEHAKLVDKHGEAKTSAAIEELGAWIERRGARRKNHYACLNDSSWVWEKVSDGKGTPSGINDQTINDYAKQLRILKSEYGRDDDIARLYRKIRDAIGPDGLATVKERA